MSNIHIGVIGLGRMGQVYGYHIARPMPLAAPVTTATFPSIDRRPPARSGMGTERSGSH